MRILVSNDDGIYSPGIASLARVATRFGEVRVVAPDVEQSGASHAVTATRPVTYRSTPIDGVEAYRVNGTPADCVALGAHHWDRVDLVLSGINLGANLGNAVWHSGTVAAAKQAALLGIRAIAFSAPISGDDPDFTSLEPHVEECLRALLPEEGPRLVNVNVPREPRGMCWTRQFVEHYHGRVVADKDPAGRPIYWFTVAPVEQMQRGTDLWAVEHGYISITPLLLDLTDHAQLEQLQEHHPLAVEVG
jgi:5'-nucleotidase